ncbi:MAG TPA: EamA family transporter [Methanoregula sp.]|nr:EamA family transporter [Methanoregula sp.]
MFWAVLAGIAACTNAAYFIANRNFLKRLDPNLLASAGFLCTSFFLLAIAIIHGIPALGPQFLLAVAITTVLNIIATTLTFRALVSSDISLTIPMLSFTPLFLVGTAALLLGEIPSVTGILGIVIVVCGSNLLNTAEGHTRILDPFRDMIRNPGIMAMLVVAFLYSVAINFDKMVVLNSDVFFGSGIVFLGLGTSFGLIATLGQRGHLPPAFLPPRPLAPVSAPALSSGKYLAVAGILTGILITIEAVAINTAYLLAIVPYVIAIKRMSIILVVLYGTLIFRENDICRRLAGAGLMVAGAVLILAFP